MYVRDCVHPASGSYSYKDGWVEVLVEVTVNVVWDVTLCSFIEETAVLIKVDKTPLLLTDCTVSQPKREKYSFSVQW
jgi:hypothetical protein